MGAHETKAFKSGNSVALRLPKALQIKPGERMLIEQDGDRFTFSRLKDKEAERRKLLDLIATLDALPRPSAIQTREPFDFPDRPGL